MTRGSDDAVVRSWQTDEGWGVLDCPSTPGGCWAHFSAIDAEGFRSLTVGDRVRLQWEHGDQDGYAFRAVRIQTN
ncbi:cold shock domain-containing protein [Kribbella sandramycini]|uniref:Cold shock domain-containing protein n=1 Tax=Kribbella sandramycini TaxID=60450 RepID=A0A7Y4KYW8_9ACTN|nr:cold shock domain-containing protein [Kribbella sandramycini]MBB6568934.1 CspA family cold shock protein [Kribbella sandramycini]NOL41220.1 cold shock domain-containing protein [Kribbella sandramycini]